MFGRVYVVCQPCQRFVGLGAWLDRLDTRRTSFSCSTCGRPGKLVFDDPAQAGLQHDLRANPVRHPNVDARLRQAPGAGHSGRQLKPAREMLPQTTRPRLLPEPRYRLKPMPFKVLGDLPPRGLALEIWCSRCKCSRPVKIGDQFHARRFGHQRFKCTSNLQGGAECGGLGHPHIVPIEPIERGVAFVSLNCPRCVPPWSASPVLLPKAPWSAAPIDVRTERYRCPGCGGQVVATFHNASASDGR